jgi:hypothetical protein
MPTSVMNAGFVPDTGRLGRHGSFIPGSCDGQRKPAGLQTHSVQVTPAAWAGGAVGPASVD